MFNIQDKEETNMRKLRNAIKLVMFCAVTAMALAACGGGGGDGATVPVAPAALTANAGNGQVTVSWTAVAGAVSYNIYYAASTGVTKTGTKVAGAVSPQAVTGLTNGTTYFFVVTAVNAAGESNVSAEKSATPSATSPPAAPANVRGAAGAGKASISWDASVGTTSYNIYYSTTSGVTKATGTKVANAVSPRDVTGLTNGTTYFFVVTAVNANGESAESFEVFATPAATPPPTYTISGAVSGDVLSGVTITLSSAGSPTTTTNASGNYSFSGIANGSYTVTPSKAGYTFAPSSSAATVSGANITGKNFVATAVLGTNTASGTYTWNSATGVLALTWTSSNFTCNGPKLGTDTTTGVTITTTTMTLPGGGAETGTDMVFTRSSGTAGDIVGTWTSTESTGNSYTLTSNANGTFSLVGVIVSCGGGGQNPSASSQHWSDGYSVQLGYDDSPRTATSVSVTGPGINGSKALTYNTGYGSWNSWTSPSTQVSFGTTFPAGLPFTYTFSITDTTTWTATSTVSCFQERFATNLSPTGTVTGTPTFSWTGIGDSSATYGLELNDSSGNNQIWSSYNISGTSIVYGGPALTSGTTYSYFVSVRSSSACSNQSSFAYGSFTHQ